MKRLLAIAAIFTAFTVPGASTYAAGLAELLPSTSGSICYGRGYDNAHMAKHPNQLVTEVKLKLHPLKDYYPFTLSVRLRGRVQAYQTSAYCHLQPNGGSLYCFNDCDESSFEISASRTTGSLLMQLQQVTFGFDCETGNQILPEEYTLSSGIDDREFRLDPLPASECVDLK